jgi:NAD(P)H-nitrite reductase large subunit
MELDKRYHAKSLPGKFKMAVSGCHLSCAEFWVRDIGLKEGWQVIIGGNVGAEPRIAQEVASGIDDSGTFALLNYKLRIVGFLAQYEH